MFVVDAVDEMKIKQALHCLVQAVHETDPVEVIRWLDECQRLVAELRRGVHDGQYNGQ